MALQTALLVAPLPKKNPRQVVKGYVRQHCRAELCVEEVLGKTGRVQQIGQFCGSLNSSEAPMLMYVVLKYPCSLGPAHRKRKAEGLWWTLGCPECAPW